VAVTFTAFGPTVPTAGTVATSPPPAPDFSCRRRRIWDMWSAWPITLTAAVAVLAAGCGSHTSRDASERRTQAQQLFAQAPSVGVACPTAGSIACDRVGLAVWLKRPATRVTATIEGQRVRLRPPHSKDGWWEGFLQPAGLIDGPLRVTPDRGRSFWQGSHPRHAHLTIVITRAAGRTDRASLAVPLRAGWG
jgi:hypothetical protein